MPTVSPKGTRNSSGGPKGLEYLQQVYFAGPRAKTAASAPNSNLILTPDGVVRFEQPDNEATSTINSPLAYGNAAASINLGKFGEDYPAGLGIQKLKNLFQHPTLYEDYPELADTPVVMLPAYTESDYGGAYSSPMNIRFGGVSKSFKGIPKGVMDALYNAPRGAFFINPAYAEKWMKDNNASMDQYFRELFVHETQHWIDEYERTDLDGSGRGGRDWKKGIARYMDRPTEVTAYYAGDRRNLPPEKRYGDVGAVEAYLRDNARWADSGISGLPNRDNMLRLDYEKALRKLLDEQTRMAPQ